VARGAFAAPELVSSPEGDTYKSSAESRAAPKPVQHMAILYKIFTFMELTVIDHRIPPS
jgi:hypothetical protein